jgi:uncharacterized protein (DUF885 family)
MKRTLMFVLCMIWLGIGLPGCGSFPTQEPLTKPDVPTPTEGSQSPSERVSQTPAADPGFTDLPIDQFFEESFRALMLRSPETILSYGLTEFYGVTDVRLDDISDAYRHQTYQLMGEILKTLEGYDREALTPEQRVSYDVYKWHLEDQLAGQAFMYHDYPATYFSATAIQEDLLLFFTDIHPIESLHDAHDYVTRLGQVGTKIDQLIEGLEIRKEAGITPPDFAIQWAVYGSLGQFVVTPARQTALYTSLKEKLDLLSSGTPEEKQAVLDEAERTIEEVVLPAYRKLNSTLSSLKTYSGGDSGVWRLPDGEDYYANRLRHYTTTDLSADEIYQLGLQELDRIQAEMQVIFDQLGYPQNETLVQSFDRVARDGGHISGNEVLTTYEQLISEADQNLETAFDIRPLAKVIVVPDQYGGFYISGSIDGSRPGAFYAGIGGAGEDLYAMPTLAYHEAIPGHHFQISLALEMKNLPSFRQGLTFTAYAEGWALYAEQLANDLGWYDDDPYGKLGFLQAQAFRAARLVVDTGLHAQKWTFDQAQQFFTENTGFEVGDSVNPQHQIARYLVWPGQSTSYYVGYLKIMGLRQRAMDQLGDDFDLKEFHRVVLSNGSMPLEILEQVVDEYIKEKSSSNS